ncbi:YceI family protein [Actinocrinis sp.]|uniref:YceI family protein n=1 Tax=Actinocrinis sp. TaxID=1920516 RepID=UPI002D29FA57|nr:YceI family protein [Actinocrinis sp.]HZP55101.1 YceI family protein [Actinocrinis sp.]
MTASAPGQFVLDTARSTVAFRHKTMWGLVTVKGTFKGVSGDGKLDADGSATGVINVRADSVDTKNTARDKHLRSDDFFAAERFPVIKFDVLSAVQNADGTVRVEGLLTVREVTQALTITATLAATEPAGVTLVTQFDVDRAAFGITWNQLGMLRGVATITATLRFARTGS